MLVLLAHPALHRSRVNRALGRAARQVDGVTVHDLYAAYPNHFIDVEHEQSLLAAHDAIVWQFPLYWYSTPALLKDWQDQVLTFNWAFGPRGDKLAGKTLLAAVSTGGPADRYTTDGTLGFTLNDLFAPLRCTATLCKLRWRDPIAVHSAFKLDAAGLDAACVRYTDVLRGLVADQHARP